MKFLLIAVALILAIYIGLQIFASSVVDSGLDQAVKKGAVILDVRTASEFEKGHIEGATNISLGTIRERWVELDSSKTYILCCSHGLRSAKVKSILTEKGFENVLNGGIWTELEKVVEASRGKN